MTGIAKRLLLLLLLLLLLAAFLACRKSERVAASPSILLVTLDTTRFDAIGPATPEFNELAARGMRFTQAFTTVPETLPSHVSMMTGLYAGGHGIHENGRYLDASHPVLAERLRSTGYRTAAFVSTFVLGRRFGLGRGFEFYDDDFGDDGTERDAKATTDRALSYLDHALEQPLFLWVHYYDPHTPWTPPEPWRTRHAKQPYIGEVAFMDAQMGRLIAAFERRKAPAAIIIVADHGEGLGEHGEGGHGYLLYQPTMHVPLLIAGPGVTPGSTDTPVSTRRVFQTILDWAGIDASQSLRGPDHERVIAGEAMKPFLSFGWQPQVMAVEGRVKAIMAGRLEVYDLLADPRETRSLAAGLSRSVRKTLREYPRPTAARFESTAKIDEGERRRLESLGYISSTARPAVRRDAPNPADMTALFPILSRIVELSSKGNSLETIPLLEALLREDPHNLDAALRLANAHSALGHDDEALAAFRKAAAIVPDSPDVRIHLALHYIRTKQWPLAAPIYERLSRELPDHLLTLEGLAVIREFQGRYEEALLLRQRIHAMRTPTVAERIHLAELAMRVGRRKLAIDTLERARIALDRVQPGDATWPRALFQRARVSVMLKEPDRLARIETARRHADPTTREWIANEPLFKMPAQ